MDNTAHPDADTEGQSSIWIAMVEHVASWAMVTFHLVMLEIGIMALGIVLWPIIRASLGRRANSNECSFIYHFYLIVEDRDDSMSV